ncbi:rhamnosyltransferase [Microbacterium trichothecenolyticum]|uniref:glycosyltransferase n=1 Tax=Microbacterium trichothecenolyticum TaxID=69370 RepID=UPI00286636EF|nr:glycosyltransferase [Microbacterium trichothecenolyticum]MDR7112519.1 rhamnosyltransferase [Microbacterium trichothecenolyticum]
MTVAAVVTSFRPDAGLLRAVQAVGAQVDHVFVVDDGSGQESLSILAEAEATGATVIRLPGNLGIAEALNRGISAALEAGADAVLTLDQDSLVPDGFVDGLRAAADASSASVDVRGPVVPEYFAGVRQVRGRDRDGALLAHGAIQSGMLLDRDLIEDVGLMSAQLFIDLVDTEFELRCLAAGRPVIAAEGLRLAHSLGVQYRRRGRVPIPGVPRVMTLSSPFRYYYRARNRVLVHRAYWRRVPARMLRDALVEGVYFAVVISLARPRSSMLRLVRAGLRAGWRGEGGRIPAEWEGLAAGTSWAADRVD